MRDDRLLVAVCLGLILTATLVVVAYWIEITT